MMKRVIWTFAMLGAVQAAIWPGVAMADNCVASTSDHYKALDALEVIALLVGNMACYSPTGGPPWENQEYLTQTSSTAATNSTGTITDYKHGPPAPGNKDPMKVIGTYTITSPGGGGRLTHTYTPGGSFVYTVWGTQTSGAGTYDFCNATLVPLPGKVLISIGGPHAC